MEREGDSTFAVDLFTDVLVREDGTSYVVTDRDEFRDMLSRGVISAAEGRAAANAGCGSCWT
jgi:predicted RNA-binding protein associated with RNAse of E/G family